MASLVEASMWPRELPLPQWHQHVGSRLEETMSVVRVYRNVVTSWHLVLDSSITYH